MWTEFSRVHLALFSLMAEEKQAKQRQGAHSDPADKKSKKVDAVSSKVYTSSCRTSK